MRIFTRQRRELNDDCCDINITLSQLRVVITTRRLSVASFAIDHPSLGRNNNNNNGGWWVGGWVPTTPGEGPTGVGQMRRGTCDTCQSLIGRRRIQADVACHVAKIDTCHHLIGPRGTHCHVSNLAKKCHFSTLLEKGSKPTSYYNPY